jgi:hypothetical protein
MDKTVFVALGDGLSLTLADPLSMPFRSSRTIAKL